MSATGWGAWVPARDADPKLIRDLLVSWYGIRDAMDRTSADFEHQGEPLATRIGLRLARAELDQAIGRARRWLTACARKGGRGVLPRPGCRGGVPAVMGHGCPALVPAVGPAPAVSTGHATASPADPLLLGLPVQELPVAGLSRPADIISTKEAESCA